MDDTGLSNGTGGPPAATDPLAGAAPVVEQTVRSVLEQHIASVTRKAFDRRAAGLLDNDAARAARHRRPPSGSSPSWPTRPASTT